MKLCHDINSHNYDDVILRTMSRVNVTLSIMTALNSMNLKRIKNNKILCNIVIDRTLLFFSIICVTIMSFRNARRDKAKSSHDMTRPTLHHFM